jgi:hypothetical protein
MPPEPNPRALVPYGYFERSLLHPVALRPARRRLGRRAALLSLPALALAILLFLFQTNLDLGPVSRPFSILRAVGPVAGAHILLGAGSPAPAASPSAAPAGAPFVICYSNPAWTPPDADVQASHFQADPRYRGADFSKAQAERIHPELGPSRSSSALGDFIALSGLWTDPKVNELQCPASLQGKAELWGLRLRFQGFDVDGADLTARVFPQPAGVEIVQVALPPGTRTLHFLDDAGAQLAPDVSLGGS